MSLPLPSTVIGSSSCPQTHLTFRLNATRTIQSRSTSITFVSSRGFVFVLALHFIVSKWPIRATPLYLRSHFFLSFPPPPISLLYILFIRPLGRTIARDGLLPTLWNKSSVSILADIVAGTHTYTHARTHTQTHTPPGNFTAPCILLGVVLALRSKDSLTDCLMGQRPSLIQDDSLRCLGL